PLKHPGDTVGAAELAAVCVENLADLRRCAIAIVSHDLAEDGCATRAVALVEHFLHLAAGDLARAALDRPLNIVLGHADGFGVVDRVPQAEIGVRIAA